MASARAHHKRQPFEHHVRNVEDGQEPLILSVAHIQRLTQARRLRIADVAAVQDGAQIFTAFSLLCVEVKSTFQRRLTEGHQDGQDVQV